MSDGDDEASKAGRREARLQALRAMSSRELSEEISRQASRPWRSRGRLIAHAKDHQGEFVEVYGRLFKPSEVDALANGICSSPDRLLTQITHHGIEWYFIDDLPGDSAMIVVVRGDWRRSIYVAKPCSRWMARHAAAIEVFR